MIRKQIKLSIFPLKQINFVCSSIFFMGHTIVFKVIFMMQFSQQLKWWKFLKLGSTEISKLSIPICFCWRPDQTITHTSSHLEFVTSLPTVLTSLVLASLRLRACELSRRLLLVARWPVFCVTSSPHPSLIFNISWHKTLLHWTTLHCTIAHQSHQSHHNKSQLIN